MLKGESVAYLPSAIRTLVHNGKIQSNVNPLSCFLPLYFYHSPSFLLHFTLFLSIPYDSCPSTSQATHMQFIRVSNIICNCGPQIPSIKQFYPTQFYLTHHHLTPYAVRLHSSSRLTSCCTSLLSPPLLSLPHPLGLMSL